MKKILPFLFLAFIISGCKKAIKNTDEKIIDEINESSSDTIKEEKNNGNPNLIIKNKEDIIGFWVGLFENANNEESEFEKSIMADDGLYWTRENKINISIDKIDGKNIEGHSVVAGNNRPFKGTLKEDNEKFSFEVSEPGDNKYDGKFNFEIKKNDTLLNGIWTAFKKIEIPKRAYELQKKIFKYNPNQMLEQSRRYGNWENSKRIKTESEDDKEFYGDFYEKFSGSTEKIYQINASNTLLKKQDVENLKKGDLLIIRNTIYARHGYSFKDRPLRVFFDAQKWYIPVHTDIKSDLTETEKKNIKLLLKYEKNAKEYYDTFGRG